MSKFYKATPVFWVQHEEKMTWYQTGKDWNSTYIERYM